jgi:hypothetical protein
MNRRPGLASLWIRKAGGTRTSCISIFTAYCTKAVGTPEMVRADLHNFIKETGADELMITCQIFEHAARLRSFEIAAEALSR